MLTRVAAGVIMLCGLATQGGAQTPRPAQPAQARPVVVQTAPATQPAFTAVTQGAVPPRTRSADIVARVGNSEVSIEEIMAYVANLSAREQAAVNQDPALLSQAVRALLANRLVLQELLSKKWDQQPNVAAQLDRLRETALAELYLQSVSVPPANYPSDDELQKVYDANRDALLVPRQFQLAQIFVAVPKGSDRAAEDNAKKVVDDLQRKLKVGSDFAGLANENGAKNGGDLGWIAEQQIRPEIRNQVMGLAKNALSEPIRLDDGWHILKLIDTKASYTRTLPEVKEALVQQMRSEQASVLRRAYLADLLKKSPPAINEIALSKVLHDASGAKR
nr:peptidylprolyl isomerase [Afipia massiliensis]